MQLSNNVYALWGKKKAYQDKFYYLPLINHLLDTRNIITYLYKNYLNDSQRHILTKQITPNIVGFLGFIHDIGKITPSFQIKKSKPLNKGLDERINKKLLENNINLQQANLVEPLKTPHNIAGEVILENNKVLNHYFGSIIGAHHGKPVGQYALKRQLLVYPENYGINPIWKQMQEEVINYGLIKLNNTEKETLVNEQLTQKQIILLTGLVIMADWLASNEHYFPLIKINQDFNDIDVLKRFQIGITKWNKEDQWLPKEITDVNVYFNNHFNLNPRPIQKEIINDLKTIKNPGLTIIEAPMGIGKTEIALSLSEMFSQKSHKSGIYFGLPTQSTANGMLDRFKDFIKTEPGTQGLKLMHGKAQFNEDYQKLTKNKHNVIVDSWFSKKLSSLETFTLGTIDQLLAMSLMQRHLFLKHLGFSQKVVIIDEVHAYDIYMFSYLKKALMWLSTYNVPVIALSATLPFPKRQELVNAYLYGKHTRTNLKPTLAYPLVTCTDNQDVKCFDTFSKLNTKKVTIKHLTSDSPSALAQKATNLVKNGGICGIIVNSISRAQEVANEIKIPHLVLHSAFLAKDRSKLEQKLLKLIGKHGKRPNKFVIIGTQVLEQSLDIDFDVLISDLAPMDELLQRIGRLQRFNLKRSKKFDTPTCYVAYQEDSKSYQLDTYLYTEFIIQQTLNYLPNEIELPTNISKLVQNVYKNVNIDEPSLKTLFVKEQQKAKIFQIAKPSFKPKAIDTWLNKNVNTNAENVEACVRDIKPQFEMILINQNKMQFLFREQLKDDNAELETLAIKMPYMVNGELVKIAKNLANKNWPSSPITLTNFKIKYTDTLGLVCHKL